LNNQDSAGGKPVLHVNRKGIKAGHLFLLVTALQWNNEMGLFSITPNNQIVKSEKDETCCISKPLISGAKNGSPTFGNSLFDRCQQVG